MDLTTTFEVPDYILTGLLKGELVRHGGVIQWAKGTANAGQTVMWLRETCLAPIPSYRLGQLFGRLGQMLALTGSIASVINLGATVAVGIVLYNKLANVEARLQEMKGKIEHLQWTVELGFATVLNSVDHVFLRHEIEMRAKVQTAARLAWEAQALEPHSPQRTHQLGDALTYATEAYQQLYNHLQHEMETVITSMERQSPTDRLSIEDSAIMTLRRFRQTCVACSLRAAIQAETGSTQATAASLERDQAALQTLLDRLGQAFIRGADSQSTSENSVYREFMDVAWINQLPASRIETLSRRFDPSVGGLAGVFNLTRPEREKELCKPLERIECYQFKGVWEAFTTSSESLVNKSVEKHREKLINEYKKRMSGRFRLPTFVDGLDGAYEDVDRLSGHAAEYQTAAQHGLSIQDYRNQLALKDCPGDREVVFLMPDSVPLVALVGENNAGDAPPSQIPPLLRDDDTTQANILLRSEEKHHEMAQQKLSEANEMNKRSPRQ